MADPPRYPDSEPDDGAAGRGPSTGAPRAMQVLVGVVVVIVVALIVILHLTGTIGPGAHS